MVGKIHNMSNFQTLKCPGVKVPLHHDDACPEVLKKVFAEQLDGSSVWRHLSTRRSDSIGTRELGDNPYLWV
jgi:hypothetical protein